MLGLPDWAVIVEKPEEHIGAKIHVRYYTPGCTFFLRAYDVDKKIASVEAPATHKKMDTFQDLYFRRGDHA